MKKVTSNLGRGLRLRSVLKDAVTEFDLGSEAILKLVRTWIPGMVILLILKKQLL